MEQNSLTYDLLKSIHNEMKIAVQNHQLLVLRRKMCPSDPDIESHINVIQGLIISLGRSQIELLTQLRKEPGFSDLKIRLQGSPNFVPKGVPCPHVPKPLSIFNVNSVNSNTGNHDSSNKEKKIGIIKYRKENIIQVSKSIQQSLLKVKGGKSQIKKDNLEQKGIYNNKLKLICNKKNEDMVLKLPKKQMSVLRSKSDKGKETNNNNSDDISEQLFFEKYDPLCTTLNNSQNKSELISTVSPTSSTNGDGKILKISPSRSGSLSDESNDYISDKQSNVREQKLVKKYDTRFLRKKKYSDLFSGTDLKKSLKTDIDGNAKLDGDSSGSEANEIRPLKPEDLGQELFLSYFGLVSQAKGDVLKRKRCERKRRSVAGQSSFYSDYYQPVPQSKRNYVKKSTSSPTSPTSQVIVETAIEIDDEDEKPKYCMVCNETGLLESCRSCTGTYHDKCKPSQSTGCPNCSPQPTDINSIVGANYFGSPSSYEIIKRYSVVVNESTIIANDADGEELNKKLLDSK